MERCRTELPPRFDLADGQWAACWLYADGADSKDNAGDHEKEAAK
jgi:peptide/nickel transport system ATP-binding protein